MLRRDKEICSKCGKTFTVTKGGFTGGTFNPLDTSPPVCPECRKEETKEILNGIFRKK